MNLKLGAYRIVMSLIGTVIKGARLRPVAKAVPELQVHMERAWFHAASVGELEVLWPVIKKWAAGKQEREVIITVFSSSAEGALVRLLDELKESSVKIAHCGYSPWEGRWSSALSAVKPSFFVTAKYEAWPELWHGLSERRVPLVIVGAAVRKSLKVAKTVCGFLGASIPRMLLLPVSEHEESGLKALLPDSRVLVCGEPRWDRVMERSLKGNARAASLVREASSFPRPWGVLGSVWPEDLAFLKEILVEMRGTLWFVPHRVDTRSVAGICETLKGAGLAPRLSSDQARSRATNQGDAQAGKPCWLIDEMGFLSELYAVADWAFVGGGFGRGVHSTIEPAIQGIPIGIGPNSASLFPEIAELENSGQLTILKNSRDLAAWAHGISSMSTALVDQRTQWRKQAMARLGATSRVLEALEDFVTPTAGMVT